MIAEFFHSLKGIEGDFPGSQIPPRPPFLKGGNSIGMCRCCITYVALYRISKSSFVRGKASGVRGKNPLRLAPHALTVIVI